MAYYKRKETRYPNIYEYETKKGRRYAVRLGYTHERKTEEFNQMGIKTIAKAKSILRKVEDKIDNLETGLIKNKNITVREYFPVFREDKLNSENWNKTSLQSYDSAFNNHLLPMYGDTPLIRLERTHYQRFITSKINDEGYSPETVRSINNCFMALINHAVDVGVIERNRLKRIRISEGDYKPKKKHLTIKEYNQFMASAKEVIKNKVDYSMIYLSTFGLRRGEIMGLSPRYVHFDENDNAWLEIKRTRTQEYPDGKGPKNPSSERTIVIDSEGSELLAYAIEEAEEIKKDFGQILHQDDFIFIDPSTGEPYHIGRLNSLMKTVSRASGIYCHPHMMRHTFATLSRIENADPRLLADYLGHKNTTMTDHYSHATAEGMMTIIDLPSRRKK